MTQYIKKLPAVFQTVTEKKFFDATFDQVFSKKDSDLLAGYLGRRIAGDYNPVTDFYLPEPSKDRTWWQLEATAFARTEDTTKSNIYFYDDLLNRIKYYGGNILNQDRLFESEYYSFGPPIDYDMFINYQNYYWIEQGLPAITLTGVTSADIIGKPAFNTSEIPGATPLNLTITTGMSIIILGDPIYGSTHTVENMGGCTGIQLIPPFPDFTSGTIFEYLPWDGSTTLSTGRVINNALWDGNSWDTQTQPGSGDYLTIERGAADKNSWSRTNKWFHIDAITASMAATGTSLPSNATRALRPIIQFIAGLELYGSGTQFRSSISYGLRDNGSGNPLRLVDYNGQTDVYIDLVLGINLVGGELVSFFNDDTEISVDMWDEFNWDIHGWETGSAFINQYIFQTVVTGGIVTFIPYTSYATPIIEGDIVFITEDGPFDAALKGQVWFYSSNVWQEAVNDKISLNQAPLFQLYDHNGVGLNDPVTYPLSTFAGSKIFSYKINTSPGATTDPVLGFPIVYTGLGQSLDIVFQNNLMTNRYTYTQDSVSLPINGYYYYKIDGSTTLYNNWNLYQPCPCSNIDIPTPASCLATSKQRVIDKFVVGYGSEYQFKLSVTPYDYPGTGFEGLDILVFVNSTKVQNANETADGYTTEIINNNVYVDLTIYLTNLLSVTQSQPPVVEIYTYTQGLLDPLAPGYFEIPQQLDANPLQKEIFEISGSNLVEQFSSIIGNQIDEEGGYASETEEGNPEGANNYRDTRKNRSVGSFILQNLAPLTKTMLVSSSDDLDFIVSERFSQDEYTKFKNKYLRTALQLINQGFNPVQYHNNTIVISAWVEEILKIVNVSNEFSSAFAYSYMIANGSPRFSETQIVPLSGSITVTSYVDLSDPKNAMYIYDIDPITGAEELLVIGKDYEIVSSTIPIDIQVNADRIGNTLFIALYKNPLPAYIPSTPSKIGAYPTYLPRIEYDTSYAIPTHVIIGHDGSKTIAYSKYVGQVLVEKDYRDQLLLELEKRIYNLIQYKFRHQYYLPVRVEEVKSGYFRETRYSRQEYLDITESYLNKWCAKNRANYRANDWYSSSLVTPTNELWKLYNYTDAVIGLVPLLGAPAYFLPGNWKGIYQYYYDTCYPNTRPWEMLGFSEKPSWWNSQYGPGIVNPDGPALSNVWPNTPTYSLMWHDLEYGIIRQGPSAIYNPVTLLPQEQSMWARPGLSAIIPVDSTGQIIPIPTLFDIAIASDTAPFTHFDKEWKYGDGSPVEQAWMSTSSYAFNIQEFLYLMKPASYGELMWDTSGTQISAGMLSVPGEDGPVMSNTNWQYVQNDTYTNSDPLFAWMRPKNSTQLVHAESVDNIIQVRYGYQRWISDRILFLGKDITSTFGQKIRTLDVNLANKLAGFTNKDTTNIYIESVSPNATTNSLIIPSTDFSVLLHKSPVVDTYSYSGVIVRALVDGTFAVYGYDLLNAEFITLDRSDSILIDVTIGGTPEPFLYFVAGSTYNAGDIVRYNGIYYLSLVTQTVQQFRTGSFEKLKSLPIKGGVSVIYKPVSSQTITKIPYGTVLKTSQAVFDFLIGWGAYLESRGWQFQDVNQDTNILNDWLTSAKQFLFWLNSSWAPDASIQLSPLSNKATLTVSRGYPNDVESLSNGVYSILDKFGVAMPPNNTTTDREGRTISVEPTSLASGGIYYLQVNTSETEHVIIIDNVTSFNDTVYIPLLRSRQQRIRFNGFRSNGWYGKMEAPGYLVLDNQLMPNFDTIVDNMRYYYDPNVTIDNPSLEDLGRHLIGYESKSYLDNLQVANDVQYLFYQGAIRQKGTKQAFEKLFRSTKIQSNEIIQVFEEWALRLSKFGNTIEQVSTEFILEPEQNTGDIIVARLNYVPSTLGTVKRINVLNAENIYTSVPKVVIGEPDAEPLPGWTDWDGSVNYAEKAVVMYPDIYGNKLYYSSNVADNQWNTPSSTSTYWTLTLTTRVAKAYIILNNLGKISRVDMTDNGAGYLKAPIIDLNSGSESHALDNLYAVWQGDIIKDAARDNIIDIDINDTALWTVRPADPAYSLVFPTTANIDYPLPNAGYVNFDDVTWSSFDVTQTAVRWGTADLNPAENDTVWVAKNFVEDWSVYKMTNFNNNWSVTKDSNNDLILLTDYGIVSTLSINLAFGGIGADAVLAPIVDSYGHIVSVVIIEAGIDYTVADTIVAARATPGSLSDIDATFSIITGVTGEILTVTVLNPSTNSGYAPISDVTIIPELWTVTEWTSYDSYVKDQVISYFGIIYKVLYNTTPGQNPSSNSGYFTIVNSNRTDFGNMISLQQVVNSMPVPANNYTVGVLPYTTTDYNAPGTYTDPDTLITYNAYYITTLAGVPITNSDIGNYADFTNMLLFKTMRFAVSPDWGWPLDYIQLNEKIWVDDIAGKWNVSMWEPSGEWYALIPFRQQADLINTSLFESAGIFGVLDNTEIIQLPIYDPFKNILPGPAKQNITYISPQDPASYNVTGDPTLFSENIIFAERQVGQLWWDLSSLKYVYYEQPIALDGSETETDNDIYRRDHWGQLFPGSTVAIYEWVKSSVPPALYTGTGIPRDTTTYVQYTSSNRFTNISQVNYYFWVLNTTDKPNVENRTMAALDVSSMLQSPKSQGFAFFCPIQQTSTNNSYMFYNVQSILAYKGNNVQIKYRLSERDDQEHAQWAFFREGDNTSIVTDQFWNKMVDSLCGYTQTFSTSDNMSAITIVRDMPWDIYGWDIVEQGEVFAIPDPMLSNSEKYGAEYRPRQSMFISLDNSRKVFVQSANSLLKYIPIRDNNPGWNSSVSSNNFWAYTNWYAIGYEDIIPTVVFQTLAEANTALTTSQLKVGDIVEVSNGTIDNRFVLYAVVQLDAASPVLSLETVGIENSAIMLLDTLYTVKNLYNLSVELRELLNAFRTQIMIEQYLIDQNELFFSMINYVISEQKNPDWVFKSSYIYIKENNIPLTQDRLYVPDQINNIINFITDSKPYHTQVRDYTSAYVTSDLVPGTSTDSYKIKSVLQFGPDWAGDIISPSSYILDGNTLAQIVDRSLTNGMDNVFTVELTTPDPSKKGYSQLYPYTFSLLTENNPQTFITPRDIVAVYKDSIILLYGQDYYVEYNDDSTYTVYFYNDPSGASSLVAFVWFDGGQLLIANNYVDRNETAIGNAVDDLVANADTKLPVNDISSILAPLTVAPYVGWGEIWDAVGDPVVSQILIDAGGTDSVPWDAPESSQDEYLMLLPNTISFKENTNVNTGQDFYRNADAFSGTLMNNIPIPTTLTENLDTIIVFVDPITHPITTHILPDLTLIPGVLWINGERIEYRLKTPDPILANTWELGLIRRGTNGTAPTVHIISDTVWVEKDNIMPITAEDTVWNAADPTADPTTEDPLNPGEFTSVTSVPLGGLWYAQTSEATFLKEELGRSMP